MKSKIVAAIIIVLTILLTAGCSIAKPMQSVPEFAITDSLVKNEDVHIYNLYDYKTGKYYVIVSGKNGIAMMPRIDSSTIRVIP